MNAVRMWRLQMIAFRSISPHPLLRQQLQRLALHLQQLLAAATMATATASGESSAALFGAEREGGERVAWDVRQD